MIKWYQYKCSEHNKLKKVFKEKIQMNLDHYKAYR